MISQISWTTFLTTTAVTLFAYYACVALLFYRHRFFSTLSGNDKSLARTAFAEAPRQNLMGPVTDDPCDQGYLSRYQPPIMPDKMPGEGKNNNFGIIDDESSYFLVADSIDGVSVIEMACAEDIPAGGLLLGSVSDLMDAIRTLFGVIAEGNGDTDDVTSFLSPLLIQYPLVAESKYRYPINQFICDHCQSKLNAQMSIEEINALWRIQPQQAA